MCGSASIEGPGHRRPGTTISKPRDNDEDRLCDLEAGMAKLLAASVTQSAVVLK
jgi:hypothetical protein